MCLGTVLLHLQHLQHLLHGSLVPGGCDQSPSRGRGAEARSVVPLGSRPATVSPVARSTSPTVESRIDLDRRALARPDSLTRATRFACSPGCLSVYCEKFSADLGGVKTKFDVKARSPPALPMGFSPARAAPVTARSAARVATACHDDFGLAADCHAAACHAVLGLAVDPRGWCGPGHERPERPDPLRGRGRRSHGHAVGELTQSTSSKNCKVVCR